MVIITGLGRCGTSILMKYLRYVGFHIGKNVNWHEDIKSGYELSTFYPLIDDLYHRYCKKGLPINLEDECLGEYWKGFSYREALNKVDDDYRQGEVDVVKDPRITWHPDIIESIWEARKDIDLIICHRDIKSIYNSRNSLSERYNDPKPRKELREYQVDFAEFYTRVLKLGMSYNIIYYPNDLRRFDYFWFRLCEMGLYHDKEYGKEVFDKIMDRSLLYDRT